MKKLKSENSLIKQNSKIAIAVTMLAVPMLYSPSTIFAQNGLITGAIVTVYELASFSFTKIELVDKNGKPGFTTTTDENGNFVFPTLPIGTWKVIVSKPGRTLPKKGFMLINGIGDVVCVLQPSYLPDAPFTVVVEIIDEQSTVRLKPGENILKKAPNYRGRLKAKL